PSARLDKQSGHRWRPQRRDCFGAVQLGGPLPPRCKHGRRSISGIQQGCSEAWNNGYRSHRGRKSTAPAGRACGRLGRGNSRRYGRTGVVKVTGDDAMDKNRAERTSANDLTQVQENASELVRSVGDVAGKFIKEQPFTAALIALGIGWLLGRTHRPL